MTVNFEELEARMHVAVDETLGDVIQLRIGPAGDFIPVKGFIRGPGYDADILNQEKRVKLRKELWPAPDRIGRLRAAKLGPGTFQIAGDPEDGAAHWLFDVQLVQDE